MNKPNNLPFPSVSIFKSFSPLHFPILPAFRSFPLPSHLHATHNPRHGYGNEVLVAMGNLVSDRKFVKSEGSMKVYRIFTFFCFFLLFYTFLPPPIFFLFVWYLCCPFTFLVCLRVPFVFPCHLCACVTFECCCLCCLLDESFCSDGRAIPRSVMFEEKCVCVLGCWPFRSHAVVALQAR